MIRIKEALVVEGKYDKIRLASLVDTVIVETHGFGIFKDKEQRALLRLLARERGLVIMTDSDSAGFVIRGHLQSFLPPGQLRQAYIPAVTGKERRKAAPSKEGLLGVEGMDTASLEEALRRAGATFLENAGPSAGCGLTKAELMIYGLTGFPDSAARRRRLLEAMGLPSAMTANRLLEVLNAAVPRDRFEALLRETFQHGGTMAILPNDPIILMSFLNTKLRDFYPTLDALCDDMTIEKAEIVNKLSAAGFAYDAEHNRFRPKNGA